MNPEILLEAPEDPIAELLNQAKVDLAVYVYSGGELKTKKEPAAGADKPAERNVAAKPHAGDAVIGPDFSKLAKLAKEMGLQGTMEGVAQVVLAAGELVQKALTAVEVLELKALEQKLAIEVELQGMIAQQVRGSQTVAAAPWLPSWHVSPSATCMKTRAVPMSCPGEAPASRDQGCSSLHHVPLLERPTAMLPVLTKARFPPTGAATRRRVRLHAKPDRHCAGHDQSGGGRHARNRWRGQGRRRGRQGLLPGGGLLLLLRRGQDQRRRLGADWAGGQRHCVGQGGGRSQSERGCDHRWNRLLQRLVL